MHNFRLPSPKQLVKRMHKLSQQAFHFFIVKNYLLLMHKFNCRDKYCNNNVRKQDHCNLKPTFVNDHIIRWERKKVENRV